ncbi:hypothetical protein [uncultured Methanospirillum sp.]|uniref:hypothetical protein n=1 Tax=uncultured Methanospirillum sp. TaxID=262503 RepID=UPI0029C93917|nr:hypothetical protein [uncultured Methanospirillum sp.]
MCGTSVINCPGTTKFGFPPTFVVTWDPQGSDVLSGDLRLYSGHQLLKEEYGSSMTYTPDPCTPPGKYKFCLTEWGELCQNGCNGNCCEWIVESADGDEPDSSPYIGFNIHEYSCCSQVWNEAVCKENAIILLARTGNLSQWQEQLTSCYWRKNKCYASHPFINAATPKKDLYYVSVRNDCGCPGHAVVGEIKDKTVSIENFTNWRFIQWGNLNITPGEIETDDDGKQIYQIPLGCGSTGTTVIITKINTLSVIDCKIKIGFSDPVVIFNIDNLGDVTIGTLN